MLPVRPARRCTLAAAWFSLGGMTALPEWLTPPRTEGWYAEAGTYVPAGIFRDKLVRPVPFPVTLDLAALVTGR